jgi:serine phosphatase RsbU (regulator of sigma subunit)/ligand-binding sensor domain-containing protein
VNISGSKSNWDNDVTWILTAMIAICLAEPYVPESQPLLDRWRWSEYPGLDGAQVNCIAKGGARFLVVAGTDDGVYGFDGYMWSAITVPNTWLPITALAVDGNENLWVGGTHALGRLDNGSPITILNGFPVRISKILTGDHATHAASSWGLITVIGEQAYFQTSTSYAEIIKAYLESVNTVTVPDSVSALVRSRNPHGIRLKDGLVTAKITQHRLVNIGDSSITQTRPATTDTLEFKSVADNRTITSAAKIPGEYHLFDFHVTDLQRAPSGALWVALDRGKLLRSEDNTPPFNFASIDSTNGLSQGLNPRMAFLSNGDMWVVSDDTRYGVNQRTDQTFKIHDLATTTARLHTSYLETYESPQQLSGTGININASLLTHSNGDLWVGGHNGQLHIYSKGRWEYYVGPELPIPNVRTSFIIEDRAGGVWLLGRKKRLVRVNTSSSAETFRGLHYQAQDASGGKWFIDTRLSSVKYLGRKGWVDFGESDGIIDTPNSILINSSGTVAIIGSHKGSGAFSIRQAANWERHVLENVTSYFSPGGSILLEDDTLYLGSGNFLDLRDESGNIVMARSGGLVEFRQGTIRKVTPPPEVPHYIYAIAKNQDGSIWVGGSELVAFKDDEPIRIPAIGDTYIEAIGSSETSTYVGTRRDGLLKINGDSVQTYRYPQVAENRVTGVQVLSGQIWASSRSACSFGQGEEWSANILPTGFPPIVRDGIRVTTPDSLWLNLLNGSTVLYRRDRTPPETHVFSHIDTVSYQGRNLMTVSGSDFLDLDSSTLTYSYRLNGLSWSRFSSERVYSLSSLAPGVHEFEVRSRDKYLNIDPSPASVSFYVQQPYYQSTWFITLGTLSLGLFVVVVFQTVQVVRRTRERDREREERLAAYEEELETARDLQVSLMPTRGLVKPGLEIAGRCLPASHVGGDYYQYFETEHFVRVALADVAGHAMQAAIPLVKFSGVLESHGTSTGDVDVLMETLNRSVVRSRRRRSFVCLALAELDLKENAISFCSAGCPYPLVFRQIDGMIEEVQIDSYPLGIRDDLEFKPEKRFLAPGDYVILCSDGIIEAENGQGDQFGYNPTSLTLAELCSQGLSPDALIDRLFSRVSEFCGDTPQSDDMTCVVLKAT